MISKKYRLSRKEIGRVHKKGRKISIGNIAIKYLFNNLEYSRWAINIPTATMKKATDRNRLRRIIYNSLKDINLERGVDCLINIYKTGDEAETLRQVEGILKEINV